jgi:hypothetical protein
MTDLQFDLIGVHAGYFIRLEVPSEKSGNQGKVIKAKKLSPFQFSYDPIFKHFIRELRDPENKDHFLDKHFLELKHLKDQGIQQMGENVDLGKGSTPDFTKMSYIAYLNRQQKNIDGIEEDDISDNDDDDEDEDDALDKTSKVIAGKKENPVTLA